MDIDQYDNTQELKEAFASDGYEILDEVEPQLILLQESHESSAIINKEILDSIFRLFHTMKGSAGYLELNTLQEVTHETENLLECYRNGSLNLNSEHIRLLLRTLDFIRNLLDNIENYMHNGEFENEAQEIINDLSNISSGNPGISNKIPLESQKRGIVFTAGVI